MQFSIILGLFILGTIFGSFYNVVAYRLPKGESIVFPSSHCPKCNHKLGPLELIPILSFIIQGGKCKSCKAKVSIFYPISEMMCGILFVLAYLSFGISLNLIIALTFVSILIIVILSDYYYMIIEDSVLIIFGLLILLEIFLINDYHVLFNSIIGGLISGAIMFILKKFGDFIFKKESMGGGDIKLMIIIGIMIGWQMSIITIFLSAILAFPISLIVVAKKMNHEIPYGPFLAFASLIIYFTQFNLDKLIDLLTF